MKKTERHLPEWLLTKANKPRKSNVPALSSCSSAAGKFGAYRPQRSAAPKNGLKPDKQRTQLRPKGRPIIQHREPITLAEPSEDSHQTLLKLLHRVTASINQGTAPDMSPHHATGPNQDLKPTTGSKHVSIRSLISLDSAPVPRLRKRLNTQRQLAF